MTKRIVLCADDYGQAEAISKGILELITGGRLTATSCLVNMPGWSEQAGWLASVKDKADIGLHLNFTEGRPISSVYREMMGDQFMPLSSLLFKTMVARWQIKPKAIQAEIDAQLSAFVDVVGCLPDFIDGHQHVHHLPIIKDALLRVYKLRLSNSSVYIRSVAQHISSLTDFKKIVIQLTGGGYFSALLKANSIPHNSSFSGIYDFKNAEHYRKYFLRFLVESDDKGIIMCHPGLLDRADNDPISDSRHQEFGYISGDHFINDCEAAGVVLSRFIQ